MSSFLLNFLAGYPPRIYTDQHGLKKTTLHYWIPASARMTNHLSVVIRDYPWQKRTYL